GGLGLHRLRPADLAAVGGHVGVQRHVLRLEWRNPPPFVAEDATERRNQHGLADVGGRPLQHERPRSPLHRKRPPTSWAPATTPPVRAAAQPRTRHARRIASGEDGSARSPSRYAPRLARPTPSAPAMAAIGQPAFGLAVRRCWARATRSAPAPSSPTSAAPAAMATAPRRAGARFVRSSSRAAILPTRP